MPLNVRRFCTSIILGLVGFSAILNAQVPVASPSPTPPVPVPPVTTPVKAPTSAEIMRDRISKAKAFIAVRNYNAAIYELENIRRETGDTSVQSVTNVLLMNSYLEQGDYKRAQEFLASAYDAQKINKPNSTAYYSTIAGQAVKGARNQIDRYRALGLMVSDRNLPLEAVRDIEQMRETLELVVTQTKEIGKDKSKADTAMALLEEATNSRGALARDDYDARRWKDEIADSREMIVGSRSIITNAVDGTTNAAVAANIKPPVTIPASSVTSATPVLKPVAEAVNKPSETLLATNEKPVVTEPKKTEEPLRNRIVAGVPTVEAAKPEAVPEVKPTGPLEVGSLIAYATKQSAPVYPSAARSMRTSGVVKVEVTVNETGDVAEVKKTSGPSLLQTAAKDAVRKWKFRPFVRDGQPVKATGFVNFNFSL
ncbi:MAG: energy transducer TonB [Pyrinomonadaceae bacterium]